MAIVINGSGTVTGLAVGGLPDGTVDAGTLATNSVDSAELIDGAVDDSHMAAMAASKLSGDIATASMPAGTVLQVVESFALSTTGTWTDTADKTICSKAFTPKSASSNIHITARFTAQEYGNGSSAEFYFQMKIMTGSTVLKYFSDGQFNVSASDAFHHTPTRTIACVFANSNTNERTYHYVVGLRNAGRRYSVSSANDNGAPSIKITEVQT